MDRVIEEVLFCLKNEYANYKKYKNDKNCIFFENEDFAVNTEKNVKKICKFLKTDKSKFTKKNEEKMSRSLIQKFTKKNIRK